MNQSIQSKLTDVLADLSRLDGDDQHGFGAECRHGALYMETLRLLVSLAGHEIIDVAKIAEEAKEDDDVTCGCEEAEDAIRNVLEEEEIPWIEYLVTDGKEDVARTAFVVPCGSIRRVFRRAIEIAIHNSGPGRDDSSAS